MNAKRLLRKLNYVPRWVWYAASLTVGFPISTLLIWLGFRVLTKMAEEQAEEEEREAARRFGEEFAKGFVRGRQKSADSTVRGEGYEVRDADAPKKAEEKPKAARPAHEYAPIDPDAGVEEVLRQGRLAMQAIREANDAIPDPVLSGKINSIEKSCREILAMLEQRPELLQQLRTFLRYYLPTTLKLLDARARLDNAGTPKGREVRRRIGSALDEIDRAFRNQIQSLEEYRFVDLESEMDVLSEMLRSDGLLEEEEEEEAGDGSGDESGRGLTAGGH